MSMTIAQLKQELTAHGVPLPESSARKEVYERLYQEFVVRPTLENKKGSAAGNSNGDTFSSDDEMETVGRSNGQGGGGGGQGDEVEIALDPQVVAEVDKLSNEEIYTALTSQGENIGPVVASTRQMYKKRLVRLSTGRDTSVHELVAGAHEHEEYLNGHNDSVVENTSQLSSDDEVEMPETTGELEHEPESPVVHEEAKKLTAEQKRKLEAMLNSSYYSSPAGPSPSTSRREESVPRSKAKKPRVEVEPVVGGTFSVKLLATATLVLMIGLYMAYEYFEESRSASD